MVKNKLPAGEYDYFCGKKYWEFLPSGSAMFQGRGIGEILSNLNQELASLSIITWISLLWKHESQHPFNTTGEVLLLSLDWKDLTISRTAYIILL